MKMFKLMVHLQKLNVIFEKNWKQNFNWKYVKYSMKFFNCVNNEIESV